MRRVAPLTLLLLFAGPIDRAAAGAGSCGDVNSDGIANVVDALVIARGEPLLCPATAQILVTGQITSFAAGDDGDLQRGAPFDYADNADGTITDLGTGLMWEKKLALDGSPDPLNLHDADNSYPWTGTCSAAPTPCGTDADCPSGETCQSGDGQSAPPNGRTIFEWVASLNAGAFAGYTDWRVPNVRELQSLLSYERVAPSVNPAFHGAQCGSLCADMTDPDCSCTAPDSYWTSTSDIQFPDSAWLLVFGDGFSGTGDKALQFAVRAVRAGP